MTNPTILLVVFAIAAPASVYALNRYFDALRSRWAADDWAKRLHHRQTRKSPRTGS